MTQNNDNDDEEIPLPLERWWDYALSDDECREIEKFYHTILWHDNSGSHKAFIRRDALSSAVTQATFDIKPKP